MTTDRVRVLIVDDSATARAALRFAIGESPSLEVVGEAADGPSATSLVRELAPDVVTMDVFLRRENGVDVAAALMRTNATRIVIVTAADPRDPDLVFRAMEAGVLEVHAKLPATAHAEYERRRASLVRTLTTLAKVPVVHRTGDGAPRTEPSSPVASRAAWTPPLEARIPLASPPARVRRASIGAPPPSIVLVGASTGGPPVLAALLRALPKPFPLPIAIVQHMTPGFVRSFASWLGNESGHPVSVVGSPLPLESGRVHVPIDEHHLVLEPGHRVASCAAPARDFHRPSIDSLFESAIAAAHGASAIAILLTGMGRDGARGLRALASAGACTIAQSPATCAVSSMPSCAIELGAAELVLDPVAIPSAILARVSR